MGANANINDDDSLNKVLIEIGDFKTYQVLMLFSLIVPCILTSAFVYQYVSASATLDYR